MYHQTNDRTSLFYIGGHDADSLMHGTKLGIFHQDDIGTSSGIKYAGSSK